MADSLTIDNYDVRFHERWAQDQTKLETVFVKEAGQIPKHLDVAGVQHARLSQLEMLFDLGTQRQPFAHFTAPPGYYFMRNRFFHHAIATQFDWGQQRREGSDQREEELEECLRLAKKRADHYKRLINHVQANRQQPILNTEMWV